MGSINDSGFVIVTGANGHIGREVCRRLKTSETRFLPVDVDPGTAKDVVTCDLRLENHVSRLFLSRPVRAVIHLAAILPSAFHSNPLAGVDVNLTGCFELMRQAVNAKVKRFVFASSMSVYGSFFTSRPLTEDEPAVPDEPYGASKRVVELVGETLAGGDAIEFVSLRIARVIGAGIKKTSSPWRSQIFELSSGDDSIQIPFAPEAVLSLVHVEDVARMLVTLAETSKVPSSIYNTPVETWKVRHLKELVEEARGVRVELGRDGAHGGPTSDGSRFAGEFGFQLLGLRERLSAR
ncbi:MAG TPA: NAD(P)-dependent oxidoreductase [Candidatus Acidoferrum sp.]|nr:NAD(P)-dependent oxidoreductase [Candidatus Acidoferrum sp.]